MRRALAVVVLVACSRERVVVTPATLHSHVVELRAQGKASMPTEPSGSIELSLRDNVKVRLGGERKVTVAQLIEGCPDHRPFADDKVTRKKYASCGLLRVDEIEVDRRWRGRPEWVLTVVGGVLVFALIGIIFGYIDACSGPDDGC